jgi:hypothetical protein
MGTRQMVPDPSTMQSTIHAVRCPKLPAPRFLVAAVAGSSYRQAGGVCRTRRPRSKGLGTGANAVQSAEDRHAILSIW